MAKKLSVLIILLFFILDFGHTQTLSVKGRWNIKAGYSLHKIFTLADRPFLIGNEPTSMMYKRKSNVRVEVNYGVLKWLELGVYVGFMNYEYSTMEIEDNVPMISTDLYNYPDAFAPVFGINANVHILPLFVKNQKCKWDFYIPLRYGGTYLTKYGGKYVSHSYELPMWDNVKGANNQKPNWNKYRHEYGAGLGGAFYIKNIIGFYMEVLGGQFSYWPEFVKSPYAIRIGLTAKF